jgi:hypothetical protein
LGSGLAVITPSISTLIAIIPLGVRATIVCAATLMGNAASSRPRTIALGIRWVMPERMQ